MRNLLIFCICALLSVPAAMANHHGDKKKMEAVKKQLKPQKIKGVKDLKKGDATLRKLDDKEGEVNVACCGTRPGMPPPPPPPPPKCEDGTDPDCDDDSDYDRDRDTDEPAPSEVQTQSPGR